MLYKPGNYKNLNFLETIKKNWAKLQECDKTAKEKGELVGRYIDEPFADGKAIYQIIKENKKTVRIRVCTGLGDDWVIPYWGEETTIDKEYAVKKVAQRDALTELFRKKEEKKDIVWPVAVLNLTKESALKRAEEVRAKKVESLRKQLKKLEELKFD